MKNEVPMVRLGELIEECSLRNSERKFGIDDVMGMTITKEIIPTKADVKDTDLSKFLVVEPEQFVYNPRTHGKKIGLGFNNTRKNFLISWNNAVFKVKDTTKVIPRYLYLIFCREEWDRSACFRSWGSSTEVFLWAEFSLMEIPLPSIETQRDLVAIYDGLQKIVAENEALIKEMEAVCHAFVVDCKTKYPKVRLNELIAQRREKNNNYIVPIRGVTREGFIDPKQKDADLSMYNVFYRNDFVFNPARMEINAIALNTEFDKAICSSLYEIFYVTNTKRLLPEYLNLFLKRDEFARFCLYDAIGSARNYFRVANMQDIQIPLPPIELQRSIAEIYKCLQKSKRIIEETRGLMKNLCPALVQKAAHSA